MFRKSAGADVALWDFLPQGDIHVFTRQDLVCNRAER